MKRSLFLLLILITPFIIIIIINESNNISPTYAIDQNHCTRACHNKGCIHFNKKMLNKHEQNFVTKHFETYKKNIQWLKNNPFGFSYVEMNLLLYVILFPVLSLFLFWKLIQQKK